MSKVPSTRVDMNSTFVQFNVKCIMEVLAKGPATAQVVANAMGYSRKQTYRYLASMRDLSLVHVSDWYRDYVCVPVWSAGSGVDAPKPKRFSAAESSRRCRARRNKSKLVTKG